MNASAGPEGRKPLRALALLLVPTALVAAVAAVLMTWRVPTQVELELRVERLGFVVDPRAEEPVRVLAAIGFDAMSIRSFERLSLASRLVERADPALFDLKQDRFPDRAWKPLPMPSRDFAIVPRPGAAQPQVTIEPALPPAVAANPSQTRIEPGTVIAMSVDGGPALRIGLTEAGKGVTLAFRRQLADTGRLGSLDPLFAKPGDELTLAVSAAAPRRLEVVQRRGANAGAIETVASIEQASMQMVTTDAVLSGAVADGAARSDADTYRIRFAPEGRQLTLAAGRILALHAALPAPYRAPLSNEAISVESLQLAHADEAGKLRSSVVGEGEIRFPDFPDLKPRPVKAGDMVSAEGMAHFAIAEITLAADGESLRVRANGRVDHLRVRSGVQQRDESLSVIEYLFHSRSLTLLFAAAGWAFATTLGGYRLFKELRQSPP